MLTEYIRAAMRRATYEILSDGTFYGEIPSSQGVYANAETLEAAASSCKRFWKGGLYWDCVWGTRCPLLKVSNCKAMYREP
jgi:hypothetical protein